MSLIIAVIVIVILIVIIFAVRNSRRDKPSGFSSDSYSNHERFLAEGRKHHSKHSSKSKNGVWSSGNSDLQSRNFSTNSEKLTAEDAHRLALDYATYIPSKPGKLVWGQHCVSLDEDHIYVVTQSALGFATLAALTEAGDQDIACVCRHTGKKIWQRNVSDYTGSIYDAARGGPIILGDKLYLVAGNPFSHIQSTKEPSDPTQDMGLSLFGLSLVGTGRRNASIVCLEKNNGDLVWVKQYGKVAKTFNDEDNSMSWGFTATGIADYDMGDGTKIPLIIAGTSQVGQYVWQYIATIAKSGGKRCAVALDRAYRAYVDRGKVFFINGLTGIVMAETSMGPDNLKAGDVITAGGDPMKDPFIPDRTVCDIRETIVAAPLTPASRYNIAGGNTTYVTFMADAAFLNLPEFVDTVPSFCDGLQTVDKTGTFVTVTSGQTVASKPNYDGMSIKVDFLWVPGQEGVKFTVPLSSSPATQWTVAGNLIGKRVTKRLQSGDTLSDSDANELRYVGASVWTAPCPVYFDKQTGQPLEIYMSTGQAHHIPFDEANFFDSDQSPYVPADSNYWDNMMALGASYASTNLSTIKAAEDLSVWKEQQRAALTYSDISPRGQRFLPNSLVALNLRPGHLGEYIWHFRAVGFDSWSVAENAATAPNSAGTKSATSPYGFVDPKCFHEQPKSADGDFGAPAILDRKKNILMWGNKFGHIGSLDLTEGTALIPTTMSVRHWRYGGSPSSLGGANYATSYDGKRMYLNQRNKAGDNYGPNLPNTKNYYPTFPYAPVSKQSGPLVKWAVGDSYVLAFDPDSGDIVWETLVSPGHQTVGGTSTNGKVVVAISQDNKLYVLDARTGEEVMALDQEGGNGYAAIDNNKIYVFNGRSQQGGTNTAYLRVFSLQGSKHC